MRMVWAVSAAFGIVAICGAFIPALVAVLRRGTPIPATVESVNRQGAVRSDIESLPGARA